MESESGWRVFELTGNVFDYLKYVACTEEKDREGEKNFGCRSSEGDGNCTEYDTDR